MTKAYAIALCDRYQCLNKTYLKGCKILSFLEEVRDLNQPSTGQK
ncbi:MAG: hypothetical protein V7K35_08835 [Nostoc sp.]